MYSSVPYSAAKIIASVKLRHFVINVSEGGAVGSDWGGGVNLLMFYPKDFDQSIVVGKNPVLRNLHTFYQADAFDPRFCLFDGSSPDFVDARDAVSFFFG
jgi:hypothetical protein